MKHVTCWSLHWWNWPSDTWRLQRWQLWMSLLDIFELWMKNEEGARNFMEHEISWTSTFLAPWQQHRIQPYRTISLANSFSKRNRKSINRSFAEFSFVISSSTEAGTGIRVCVSTCNQMSVMSRCFNSERSPGVFGFRKTSIVSTIAPGNKWWTWRSFDRCRLRKQLVRWGR